MDILSFIFIFIFGTIIGSFLNVIILRFNTGNIVGGRSKCMTCGKQLTWNELFPLFSYLFQRGVCRKCKSRISIQYPLVECLTGIIFVLIFVNFPPTSLLLSSWTIFYLLISCLFLIITVYDIKHKIIPDQFAYTLALLAFISIFFNQSVGLQIPTWSMFLSGPILALPFALLWYLSNGTWMGLGDAKLILGIGWLLGLSKGTNAIILAFWIAAIISITWLLIVYGKFKTRTEIPFGPYLILGFYLILFLNIKIIDFNLVKELFGL